MAEGDDWEQQGCPVCRGQWTRGEHPRFVAVYPELHERLYRCDVCATYWAETERYAAAVPAAELTHRYRVEMS